jgi:hypothetical protein
VRFILHIGIYEIGSTALQTALTCRAVALAFEHVLLVAA